MLIKQSFCVDGRIEDPKLIPGRIATVWQRKLRRTPHSDNEHAKIVAIKFKS